MPSGIAKWKYDPEAGSWYVTLTERSEPPYNRQVTVSAVLDLDENGKLAGIEIIESQATGPIPAPIQEELVAEAISRILERQEAVARYADEVRDSIRRGVRTAKHKFKL